MKVFKFKKYKDGYEDGKQGALRYPLATVAFFESQGMGRTSARGASIVEAEASPNTPSSSAPIPMMGLPSDASTAKTSTRGVTVGIGLSTPPSEAS